MQKRIRLTGMSVAALAFLVVGCAKEDDKPEHRQIEGTVESIDLDTGEVSLKVMRKKTNTPVVLHGRITNQTEVMINGIEADIKDIRPKERIKVTGYRKGKDANIEMVAVRVEIERPDWVETGQVDENAPGAFPAHAELPSG